MADKETIDDIIAEIRAIANEKRRANDPREYEAAVSMNDYADRLDAAHKRDVDKLNSVIQATVSRSDAEIDRLRREIAELKRAGNAAKLREAAEKTRSTLEEALQILNGISDEEAGRLNARLEDVADEICEVTQWIIPDALAAPPRNCDKFETKNTAREAFQKLRGHRVLADVSLWDDRDEIEAFLDWLFATKEGGAI